MLLYNCIVIILLSKLILSKVSTNDTNGNLTIYNSNSNNSNNTTDNRDDCLTKKNSKKKKKK